jgi:hypothetical protein
LEYLIKNELIGKEFSDWNTELDLHFTCYDADYQTISTLHLAELLCKNESLIQPEEEEDDRNYEIFKENLFLQLSQFYIRLSQD